MPIIGWLPEKREDIGEQATPVTIDPRLKKLDAMEGIKTLPRLFKIPMATAERDTRSRNGNMTEVIKRGELALAGDERKVRRHDRDDRGRKAACR